MDSPENSQKEHNKRRLTISKDARPLLAEKSINIQCASGKTLGSKDPLPNTNISDKILAQEISDQLLHEHNSHENNQSTAKSSIQWPR